jgi:hypothetical protein
MARYEVSMSLDCLAIVRHPGWPGISLHSVLQFTRNSVGSVGKGRLQPADHCNLQSSKSLSAAKCKEQAAKHLERASLAAPMGARKKECLSA